MQPNDKQARKAILEGVRQGLKDAARLPEARAAETPAAATLSGGREALIQSFAAELSALSGVFHRCAASALPALVLDLVAEASGGEAPGVLAWGEADLPPAAAGLAAALRAGGVRVIEGRVPFDGAERAARLDEMEKAAAGLTGAEAALADVGGLVVRSGEGRGRLASLLPATHIALVTPEQFYPSLYDWMEMLRAQGRLESTFAGVSNLTIIAGPSRTADIEKTLVLGVHGPRVLHVICVEDEHGPV
jgi:L-lactate dehydrogenase complex protein LldG